MDKTQLDEIKVLLDEHCVWVDNPSIIERVRLALDLLNSKTDELANIRLDLDRMPPSKAKASVIRIVVPDEPPSMPEHFMFHEYRVKAATGPLYYNHRRLISARREWVEHGTQGDLLCFAMSKIFQPDGGHFQIYSQWDAENEEWGTWHDVGDDKLFDFAQMTSAADLDAKVGHVWADHKRGECQTGGCIICDGGLSICKVCGGGEGALTTHCPHERMTPEQIDLVYMGKLDYFDSQWIEDRCSIHSPGFYRKGD